MSNMIVKSIFIEFDGMSSDQYRAFRHDLLNFLLKTHQINLITFESGLCDGVVKQVDFDENQIDFVNNLNKIDSRD